MTKIVLEDYPVERLPEEIQGRIADAKQVRLTVEVTEEEGEGRKVSLEDIFAERKPPYLSKEEIMDEIYKGRYDD